MSAPAVVSAFARRSCAALSAGSPSSSVLARWSSARRAISTSHCAFAPIALGGRSRPTPTLAGSQRRGPAAKASEERVDIPSSIAKRRERLVKEKPQTLRDLKIGFLGWGAMAQAVSLGISRADITDRGLLMATDVVPKLMELATEEGLQTTQCNKTLVEWADLVVLAVKPQTVDTVLKEIQPIWKPEKVMVSICAGITIDTFKASLGERAKVVRVMPNTPCLVAEAATAFAASGQCADWELDMVYDMFGAVGNAIHRVPESLLNTVTGLSGSGPAYVYMMIQALSDAGVHGGLPRNVAQSLAAQTVAGAARMVQETGQHPAVLKEAVTSPAGTTIAGVRVLENRGFNSAVIEAVHAASGRAEELSRSK